MNGLSRWVAVAGLSLTCVAWCAASPVTFHPASAMVRIGGTDGVALPDSAASYRLEMVRNEREGLQVAIQPAVLPDTGKGTARRVAPLAHVLRVEADSPDAPAVRAYQVLPVRHVAPPTAGQFVIPPRRLGLIPDVLMPIEGRGEALAPATYYIEFHTTRDTKPGVYHYTALCQAGQQTARMQIEVVVHEPVIPDRLPFRTATMWNWSLEDYFGRDLTHREKQIFWDFFLDQRLSPTAFFTKMPSPTPAEAIAMKDRGLSVINLTFVGGKRPRPLSPEFKEKMAPLLRQWREQLQTAGMVDDAVILLADEPVDEAVEVCRENARWLRQQFPEVKIWVATQPGPQWAFVDVFDPVMAWSTDFYKPHSHTDEALAWLRRTHPDKQYWWFHSVEPYAPCTNVRLDNLPIEGRVAGWQSALYGVDGYEYFWMTAWGDNKQTKDVPWPRRAMEWKTGMSGAGTLCYPDEQGLPMPSLRLVNLRDGLEDWALIEMLAPRSDHAARQKITAPVTTDLAHYTTQPQTLLKARGKVIEQLEKAK